MSITKDEIDQYFGRKVRITFEDGSQIKGILKGIFGIENEVEYVTIRIISNEKENGIDYPVKVIDRIRLDL